MNLFRGYLPSRNKVPMASVKDPSNWLENPPIDSDYVGILKENIIQLDFDSPEDSEKIMKIVSDYKLKCDVQIWPDVHDRSTTPLGDVSLIDACQQALSQGLADVLIIAGKTFAQSLEKINLVKDNLPNSYVFLGGGANFDNLRKVYEAADGAFVASCLKDSGNMTGDLDQGKLDKFMDLYKEISEN